MKYLNLTAVRGRAHQEGKRVSRSYLYWLDQEVERLIVSHARSMGAQKTLRAADVEAMRAFNSTVVSFSRVRHIKKCYISQSEIAERFPKEVVTV